MALLSIEVDDKDVLSALQALARKTGDLSPALRQIGEDLRESTLRRFSTSTGPDGQRWAGNSETTILRYLGLTKGNFPPPQPSPGGRGGKRQGRLSGLGGLSKKGAARAGAKKPLVGESKSLSTTINYRIVDGGRTLLIGSPQKYAAVQQFGAKAREFGKAPWGDIPARPFLGISDADRRSILETVERYLGTP
ncbi:MAG: phage virion morphogenesis protein [Sulfuricellaceae bacterium]|nr:phage virion morphogenesis protein [Sulfuricellaceae bacterium]